MEMAIQSMGIFQEDDLSGREKFAKMSRIAIFMPHQFIIKQDEIGEHFYFIVDGLVEVALEFKEFNYLNHDTA